MTRIGVVIVTHNSGRHVGACLDSIPAAAPGLTSSIVVIDNDSKDGTTDLVRSSHPELVVMGLTKNVGFARAVNMAAVQLADCSHLLLLNPDASMTPGSLSALLTALEAAPRAAASGPHLKYPDGRHQISARPLPTLGSTIYDALLLYHLKARLDFVEQFPSDLSTMAVDCLSGACMLIRRDCFDLLQGLDERFFLYGEDVDLCARAKAAGWSLLLVPKADVFHIEGASAFLDRALFYREIHRARSLYVRKHFRPAKAVVAVGAQVFGLCLRGVLFSLGRWLGRLDLAERAQYQWLALPRAIAPRRQ